jgi:hypothetical protein
MLIIPALGRLAGGSGVQGHHGLHGKTLSQKNLKINSTNIE